MINSNMSKKIASEFKIPRGHADCYLANYKAGHRCTTCKSAYKCVNICETIDKQLNTK